MIFITAKFQVLGEHADSWPEITDDAAGAAHVQSDHFKKARQDRIVNFTIPQDDWSELGELAVPDRGR